MSLTQGSLTVEQYAVKFLALGRFSPHLISTERMQVQKFQGRLQPKIRSQVACHRIETYQELVNLAAIAKAKQRSLAIQINSKQKRTIPFIASGNSKKRRSFPCPAKGKGIATGRQIPPFHPQCPKYGKHPAEECHYGYGVCF